MEELDSMQEYIKNNKGLKDQMQEVKSEHYDKLTLDKLTEFLIEISNIKKDSIRKFYITTGKAGYIKYRCSMLKVLGRSDKEIEDLRIKLEKELPKGLYDFKV